MYRLDSRADRAERYKHQAQPGAKLLSRVDLSLLEPCSSPSALEPSGPTPATRSGHLSTKGKNPVRGCGSSRTRALMTRTSPRRQAPAPQLPQSRRPGPSSTKLLLRANHDLGEPVPFLPPGGIELFSTLEVNLFAELLNQCLKRTIPCHALEL